MAKPPVEVIYSPPDFKDVETLAAHIRESRAAKFDTIVAARRAIRGDWQEVMAKIPQAYRGIHPTPDVPEIRDMLRRIVGRIARERLDIQVIPPSGRVDDVKKAALEEARLRALLPAIEEQQQQPLYALGIDSQCAWGESWISVWPDPTRVRVRGFERKKDEKADEYIRRVQRQMAFGNIPIKMLIHDPLTVLPYETEDRLAFVIIESEHPVEDIALGLGYAPLEKPGGGKEWCDIGTLGYGLPLTDIYSIPTEKQNEPPPLGSQGSGKRSSGRMVKSHIYIDDRVYQRYLDGVLVERWEHGFGYVPVFPAWGIRSSDNDPSLRSVGIIDTAITIGRQIVFFAAVLASNAMQHGWPTPFIENPEGGMVAGPGDSPVTREIVLGKINFLGPGEKIVFPYLDAQMMPDFYRYLDFLTAAFEGSSLGSFRGTVNSDTSGYAVAQVRAMQETILAPIYQETARQWRQILYFLRHLIKETLPAGITLPGAVETTQVEGKEYQYRPILEYSRQHATDFIIETRITANIMQDEIAERKSALEMLQAGVWSSRRVMERTGVEDPVAEMEEISTTRILNSPAADQVVLQMAMALASERYMATRQEQSSPFYQMMAQARQAVLGNMGGGAPQGAQPQNALPGGQPLAQNPPMPAPQQGGPMQGPVPGQGNNLESLGVPGIPGGVPGGNPPPMTGGG